MVCPLFVRFVDRPLVGTSDSHRILTVYIVRHLSSAPKKYTSRGHEAVCSSNIIQLSYSLVTEMNYATFDYYCSLQSSGTSLDTTLCTFQCNYMPGWIEQKVIVQIIPTFQLGMKQSNHLVLCLEALHELKQASMIWKNGEYLFFWA